MIDYFKIEGTGNNKDDLCPVAEFGHKDILITGFKYNEKEKEALIFFHNLENEDYVSALKRNPDLIFKYKNVAGIQTLIDILESVKKTFKNDRKTTT